MACGTPVVGTAWGGLNETIVHGVTGYMVSTVLTPARVKVSWWEAVNRCLQLLRDPAALERMGEACVLRARTEYSQASYGARLDEAIAAATSSRRPAPEPLRCTEFARELWAHRKSDVTPYRIGSRSYELYRELMLCFSGSSQETVPVDEPIEADQVLTLASAASVESGSCLRLDDPLYPFDVEVPCVHRTAVGEIVTAMRQEPAVTVERLTRVHLTPTADMLDAVYWMISAGILLRSRPHVGWIDPREVDHRFALPLFSDSRVEVTEPSLLVY